MNTRTGIRMLAAALGAASALSACDERVPVAEATTAFVNVNVVALDTDSVLEHQTVVIAGSHILQVGPANEITVADSIEKIAGEGRYLIPGLADMHAHPWNADELILFVAHGVTTIRNMYGFTEDHLLWREAVEDGELLGPTIFTPGPIIDGDPPTFPGSIVLTDPTRADSVVAAHRAAGYDFIKILHNLTPDVYEAIIAAGRRHQMPVVGHVPSGVPLERALASGQASIEHLNGFSTALVATSRAPDNPAAPSDVAWIRQLEEWGRMDPTRLPAIAEATARSGVRVVPTLVVYHNAFVTDAELSTVMARAEMAWVAPSTRAGWGTRGPNVARLAARSLEARAQTVQAIVQAGGRLLVGTDTPNPFVVPGFSLHEELTLLVSAGVSPYEALRAATIEPASFLEASDVFGSIRPGLRADLVLLMTNPLVDITATGSRVGVMVRGKWFPQESLNDMVDSLAILYRDMEVAPRR